ILRGKDDRYDRNVVGSNGNGGEGKQLLQMTNKTRMLCSAYTVHSTPHIRLTLLPDYTLKLNLNPENKVFDSWKWIPTVLVLRPMQFLIQFSVSNAIKNVDGGSLVNVYSSQHSSHTTNFIVRLHSKTFLKRLKYTFKKALK